MDLGQVAPSNVGLRPGASPAGLRAPTAVGSIRPSVNDPLAAAAAMPPPRPRPPLKRKIGAKAKEAMASGQAAQAAVVASRAGAKAAASASRTGAQAAASASRAGAQAAASASRAGAQAAASAGAQAAASAGAQAAAAAGPKAASKGERPGRRVKAAGKAPKASKSSSAPKPPHPMSVPVHVAVDEDIHVAGHVDANSHVPAHIEFQTVLETPGASSDINILNDMPESDNGFVGLMSDTIGLDDFDAPVDQYQQYIEEEEEEEEEEVDVVPTPTTKKWSRGGNYSVAEDEALVLAWQNVSTDPVTGKDQPGSTYWQRISNYFHNNVASSRSIGSLNHRWSSISECCARWSGCVVNIERQQASGSTMQDRLNATQELYKERDPHGRAFVMLHCWAMLQHNEKWINRDNDPHPLKKRASFDMNNEDEDDESGRSNTPCSDWPARKRPPGRKQSKEQLKRGGGGDGDMFQSAVQDIVTTKKEIEASRKEEKKAKLDVENARWDYIKSIEERKMALEQEKVRVLREEASAKKMKEEYKIMFKDLNGLDEQQRAFLLGKRAEIVAKLGGSGSGNGNESV